MTFSLSFVRYFIEDPVGRRIARDQKGNADVTFTYLPDRTSKNLPLRDSGLLSGDR
jgi:hypothetical protein